MGKDRSKGHGDEDGWTHCPECDGKVKKDNLRKHLQKVHGLTKSKAEAYISETRPRKGTKGTTLMTVAMVLLVVVLVIIAAIFLMPISEEDTAPGFHIDRTVHDFGDIQPGKVSTTFTIDNDGDGELVITGLRTSCICTETYLSVGGKKGPTVTTEADGSYKGKVAPGETGTLTVSYDPTVFSDEGPVTRYVVFTTNDDQYKAVTITVKATVI